MPQDNLLQIQTHTIYVKIENITKHQYENQSELNDFIPVQDIDMSITRAMGKNTTIGFVPFGPVEINDPYITISASYWPDLVLAIYNGVYLPTIEVRVLTSNGTREVVVMEHKFSECSVTELKTDQTCTIKLAFQYTSYEGAYYEYDEEGKKVGTRSVVFDFRKLGNAKPAGEEQPEQGDEGEESGEEASGDE